MRIPAVVALSLSLFFAGCSVGPTASTSVHPSVAVGGVVHGGQQPISGAHVYLFAANTTGTAGPGVAASAGNASVSLLNAASTHNSDSLGAYVLTDASGSFSITDDYSCVPNTQVYIYALSGNPGVGTNTAAGLLAVLGNCPASGNFLTATPFVSVNEVSTVVAAYSFAAFATDATHVSSSGSAFDQTAIADAFANAANLADIASGLAFTTTPFGNAIVPQSEINTLANILASCVNSAGTISGPTNPTACYTLFNSAKSQGSTGTVPTETATAAIDIAHNPSADISDLFALPTAAAPFAPNLTTQPGNFTIPLLVALQPTGSTQVALGQTFSTLDLSQQVLGGTPPYSFTVAQSNTTPIAAVLAGSMLASDYAYHGGTNTVSVTVTDAAHMRASYSFNVTVSVPSVVYPVFGIDYSPYENRQDPNAGSQISVDQLTRSIGLIAPYTRTVRSFGVDHGLENIGCIAHKFGLGAYINAYISKDTVANETAVQTLIQLAKQGCVDVAVIGSEALYRGDVTAAQLTGYVDEFRAAVPAVKVAAADTYYEFTQNPSVGADVDIILANYYPYFEGWKISLAIANLHAEDQQLQKAFPGKEIIVSETGFPSDGTSVGNAVPSLANAAFYFLNFESWAQAENRKSFYFEFRDEAWKTGEGPIGPHWGIFDTTNAMKYGADVFAGATIPDNWSCTAPVSGAGTASIAFTSVPPIGSVGTDAVLQGQTTHVAPSDYYVAAYIFVNGGWWTKPTFASPRTAIQCDGSFSTELVTGGSDPSATRVAAFLLPNSFGDPPAVGGSATLPQALYQAAAASLIVNR